MACPEAIWKREASSLGAFLSSAGILGTSPSSGILKDRFPWPRLMISSLQSFAAFFFLYPFKKAKLAFPPLYVLQLYLSN